MAAATILHYYLVVLDHPLILGDGKSVGSRALSFKRPLKSLRVDVCGYVCMCVVVVCAILVAGCVVFSPLILLIMSGYIASWFTILLLIYSSCSRGSDGV